MTKTVYGSCLCAKVRFRIELPGLLINNCHCSRCRKASGAAFGSFLHTSLDRFEWLAGIETVTDYRPGDGTPRPFCSNCGTRVPVVDDEEDEVIVPAGTLDGDPELRPCVNINATSKAHWFAISDGLPTFGQDPPDSFWEPFVAMFERGQRGSS